MSGTGREAERDPTARAATAPAASNLRGILAMSGSMAFFVSGDALMKTVIDSLPLGEVLAIRGAASVIVMLIVVTASGLLAEIALLAAEDASEQLA